jgi:hypothetical protein
MYGVVNRGSYYYIRLSITCARSEVLFHSVITDFAVKSFIQSDIIVFFQVGFN